MATTKKKSVSVVNEEVNENVEVASTPTKKVVEEVKQPRTYNQSDLILCRSVTAGRLIYVGRSNQTVVFSNFGDVGEIEYGDLFSSKNAHSGYIYEPYLVIEDEELLEQPRWRDVKEFYEMKVYGKENLEEILSSPASGFKSLIENLPNGMKKALAVEVAERIERGTFDSLKKINIIDDVCGTDFKHILPND